MKIFAVCPMCHREAGISAIPQLFYADYNDDLILRCPKGHPIISQSQKFELFLDCAADALINEYPLEACVNLALVRENLFIFAIEVMLKQDDFKIFFEKIRNQSERIIGAFIALYFDHFDKVFEDKKDKLINRYGLSNNMPSFRNNIIHKGNIPTLEEAMAYGDIIYNEVKEVTKSLKDKFPENLRKITHELLNKRQEKIKPSPYSTMAGSFMFSLCNEEESSFNERLSAFREKRKHMEEAYNLMRKNEEQA